MQRALALTLLVMSFLFAGAEAQAAGRWPNWYVGLHGSLDYVGESSVNDNPVVDSISNDFGFGYGASLGYRPATDTNILKNMRFELEWHQQQNDIAEADTILGSVPADGTFKVSAFMANVFYDFVTTDQYQQPKPLVPYLGAGVGIASLTMDDAGLTLGNTNNSDDLMAWQLMAGLSYAPQFMPFSEWVLGYRYFSTTDASFNYITGTTFDVDYSSHNLEAGIRFLF